MRSSTNVSLYRIAHCNLLRSRSMDAIILSAAVSTNLLFGGPLRTISRLTREQR